MLSDILPASNLGVSESSMADSFKLSVVLAVKVPESSKRALLWATDEEVLVPTIGLGVPRGNEKLALSA